MLGALRAANLVALPKTRTADAWVVEERLREVVSKATLGVAPYGRAHTPRTCSSVLKKPSPGTAENTKAA
jgi:hypothetical protein